MRTKTLLLLSLGLLLPIQAGLYWEQVGEHAMKLSYVPVLLLWFLCTKSLKVRITAIGYAFLVTMIWSTISALMAEDLYRSLFEISRYLVVFLIYLYVANYCANVRSILCIIIGLSIGLAFQVFLGLYQNHFGHSIGWNFLGEGSGQLWAWRAIGTLRFPNVFGTYLVMLIPMLSSMFFVSLRKKFAIQLIVLLVLSFAVLIFTYSRSSWAAFAIATVIFVLLLYKRGLVTPKLMKKVFPVVVLITLLIVNYSGKLIQRWEHKSDNALGLDDHRFYTAETAIDLIKREPIWGVGLRNFFIHAHGSTVHNTYLRLAAETGLPGLGFFLLSIFTVFRVGFNVVKSKYSLLSRLSIGILSAYSAFVLTIMTGPEFRWFPILAIFSLQAGLISAMKKLDYNFRKQEFLNKKVTIENSLCPARSTS